jgi:hypothetical protein
LLNWPSGIEAAPKVRDAKAGGNAPSNKSTSLAALKARNYFKAVIGNSRVSNFLIRAFSA